MYWQRGWNSITIPPTFGTDVVGQHSHKMWDITSELLSYDGSIQDHYHRSCKWVVNADDEREGEIEIGTNLIKSSKAQFIVGYTNFKPQGQ